MMQPQYKTWETIKNQPSKTIIQNFFTGMHMSHTLLCPSPIGGLIGILRLAMHHKHDMESNPLS